MIDWEKPLRTQNGLKAVRLFVLGNSAHPNVIKYTDTVGVEQIVTVDDHGHDETIQSIFNACKREASWPENREIMTDALEIMTCLSCGQVLKESSSRRRNESTAYIELYAECTECKNEFVFTFKNSLGK